MTDNVAQSIVEPIEQIAQKVVKEELQRFRKQVQQVCLDVIEDAFAQHMATKEIRTIIDEEINAKTSESPDQEQIEQIVRETATQFLSEKGQELLPEPKTDSNEEVLRKAKDLFRQSVMSGSLDLKKIITQVVEKAVESKPEALSGNSQNIEQSVQQYLDKNLAKDLKTIIENQVQNFFSSENMKELLDQKFRAIDLYLKTDLIPKVVKREISKLEETT